MPEYPPSLADFVPNSLFIRQIYYILGCPDIVHFVGVVKLLPKPDVSQWPILSHIIHNTLATAFLTLTMRTFPLRRSAYPLLPQSPIPTCLSFSSTQLFLMRISQSLRAPYPQASLGPTQMNQSFHFRQRLLYGGCTLFPNTTNLVPGRLIKRQLKHHHHHAYGEVRHPTPHPLSFRCLHTQAHQTATRILR